MVAMELSKGQPLKGGTTSLTLSSHKLRLVYIITFYGGNTNSQQDHNQ